MEDKNVKISLSYSVLNCPSRALLFVKHEDYHLGPADPFNADEAQFYKQSRKDVAFIKSFFLGALD